MSEFPFRVLHVVNSLGIGGTQKVMQQFVTNLNQERFKPFVFSFRDGERGKQLREQNILTYIGKDLLSVLLKLQPHIVHVHRAGWPEPNLLKPMKLAQTPIVVETNVFGRHDPSPSADIIDATLFVSHFCLDRYSQLAGFKATAPRYRALYNPVDVDRLMANTPEKKDYSRPIAGRISRVDPGKWSRLGFEFLPFIVRDFPDFRYHVIGGIPEAHAYVKEHDLQDNVIFLPPVSHDEEIGTFMGELSLLAHANDTGESFGLVIAEAMACALPVITHPCEGLKDNAQLELVDHGETGLIAKTAEEYANAIKYLLHNPKEAQRMGLNGQQKARRLYRTQNIVSDLESIYDELLKQKGMRT